MRLIQCTFIVFVLLLAILSTKAQISGIVFNTNMVYYSGTVVDSVTNEPIPGAVVTEVTGVDQQVEVKNHVTDRDGKFYFKTTISSQKRIEISCLGYKLFSKNISLDVEYLPSDNNKIDLGKIKISHDVLALDEVVVKARIKMYEIKGDTMLVFPRAVRTMEGDNVLEILRQIPGIEVLKDGNVLVWGQRIEKSKVNGALLFGDDPRTVLNTLDAKDASLVMIYDEADEKDEIAYGKDARKRKVVDIQTFDSFKDVVSAGVKVEGGINHQKDMNEERQIRYFSAMKIGHYNEKKQIELSGSIDDRNIIEDGDGNKPFGFNRKWNANSKISGKPDSLNSYAVNYNYNNEYATSFQALNSVYFPTSDFNAQTLESLLSNKSESEIHSIGLNYDYYNARYGITVNFSAIPTFERSNYLSSSSGQVLRDSTLLTKTEQDRDYQINRFSVSPRFSINKRIGSNAILFSIHSTFYKLDATENRNDTIYNIGLVERTLLHIKSNEPSIMLYPTLSYDINFDRVGMLTLESSALYQKESSYKLAMNEYTGMPDNALSGDEEANSVTIREGIKYSFINGKHRIIASANYQGIFMNRDDRQLPGANTEYRSFHTFIPTISYTIGQNSSNQYELSFSVIQNAIALDYLKNRLNVTNPMFIRTGNTNLKPSKIYQLNLSGSTSDNRKSLNFVLNSSFVFNKCVSNRIYYANATVLSDYNDYKVPAGATLSMPVNADFSIEISSNIGYNSYINPIKSTFNIKADFYYNNFQEGVNDTLLRTYEYSGGIRVSLVSNLSNRFKIGIKNNARYRRFENSSGNIDNRLLETINVDFRWDFLDQAFLISSYAYEFSENTYSAMIQNHILNGSIGCRLFKNRKGAISFNAYNILDRTTNFTIIVDNQSVNNIYKQLSTRFFSIAFEYKFSNTK